MHPVFKQYYHAERILAYRLFQALDPAAEHMQPPDNPDGYRIFLEDPETSLAYAVCPLGLCEFIANRGRQHPGNLLARHLLSDPIAVSFIDAYDGGNIDDLAEAMGLEF